MWHGYSTKWRNLLKTLSPECDFSRPASVREIEMIEEALEVELPPELKDFLLESNGLVSPAGRELVWPAEKIREENELFRTLGGYADIYMPFDHLLFFAGDEENTFAFAFGITKSEMVRDTIYMWENVDDSRGFAASNFEDYLKQSFAGEFGAEWC